MLHARGQRLTFCTDLIHHYYHHCSSSNRAEHHIPKRPEPTKWDNGQQFHRTGGKVTRGSGRERQRDGAKWQPVVFTQETDTGLSERHVKYTALSSCYPLFLQLLIYSLPWSKANNLIIHLYWIITIITRIIRICLLWQAHSSGTRCHTSFLFNTGWGVVLKAVHVCHKNFSSFPPIMQIISVQKKEAFRNITRA